MRNHKYKPGIQVQMINAWLHEIQPMFYPPVGTIGTLTDSCEYGCFVQWPEDSCGAGDDGWHHAIWDAIEPVNGGEQNAAQA